MLCFHAVCLFFLWKVFVLFSQWILILMMIVVAYFWKEEKANSCSKAPKEKTASTKKRKQKRVELVFLSHAGFKQLKDYFRIKSPLLWRCAEGKKLTKTSFLEIQNYDKSFGRRLCLFWKINGRLTELEEKRS